MYGLSTADGFLNVKEGTDEMIKYLANEPSVGLFFVQQHAQASMPYLLTLKDEVEEKVHEVSLHTEDTEDSIDVVRSMPECGLPIIDHMIKDINKSLLLMSTSQPKKGLINRPSWGFQAGRNTVNTQVTFDNDASSSQQNGASSRGYLSAVFSSAKQKAAGLKWPQPNATNQPNTAVESDNVSTAETDELPLSSELIDDQPHEADTGSESLPSHDLSSTLENYDKFKSDQEAKLEAWLQEP